MITIKNEEQRKRIRQWCQQVMENRGLTARAWAVRAKVAPSTLTRFLNDEDLQHTLTPATLNKLAHAANTILDFQRDQLKQVYVPVFRRPQLEAAARERGKLHLDIFAMTSDETGPVPGDYDDCRYVELDNGHLALVSDTMPEVGQLAAVWCGDDQLAVRIRVNNRMIPMGNAKQTVVIGDPNVLIFGLLVAETIIHEPRHRPVGTPGGKNVKS